MTYHDLANHLWQSTLFAAAATLLCFTLLRRNSPRVRFWVWFAASLKFLVPFSALLALGSSLPLMSSAPEIAESLPAVAAMQFNEPFAPAPELLRSAGNVSILPQILAGLWIAGLAYIAVVWMKKFAAIRRIVRNATHLFVHEGVPVLSTRSSLEPGVIGVFRPKLLLPEGIFETLTSEQLDGILAHELCHVRRRDNLTAAVHMLVEALLWFHPLVWWLGSRLMTERERACDEDVLARGTQPRAYAEGILNVCRFCLQAAPLPCVSGVTGGGELKQRIAEIISHSPSLRLGAWKTALIAGAAATAVTAPVYLGSARVAYGQTPAPPAGAPLRFEVASIRPSKANSDNSRLGPGPGGGIQAQNVTTMQLVTFAYDLRPFLVNGAPSWVTTERFDVVAKPEQVDGPTDPRTMTDSQRTSHIKLMRQRVQALLAERFQLVVRHDTKESPIYALVVGKGGPKLTVSKSNELTGSTMRTSTNQIEAMRMPMQGLADGLSGLLDRPVLDQTGLTDKYDFKIRWTQNLSSSSDSLAEGPSLFTAIQEQLGLKLESKKGPVGIIVIDKIERPSEN